MSTYVRARKHLKSSQLATLVALAIPAVAQAQEATTTLPTVKVEATLDAPYKANVSANPKYTQPLIDTPQTVSVITKETFLEQGASTLMEALRNTPGLTSQIGENGALAAGDTFSMRGVASSQSSIFVDGVRDIGAVTRDIYNIDQVEVVKGPAGADIGRGAGAGYINMISKLPSLQNSTSGSASINTGNLKRATVDYNHKVDDTSAVRFNAVAQDGGVDGRDYV
ncbi:MAG TPA: TonB-dependent receptor plug domain-containing protein, partial [Rhodocyclaceae bacterium]|nr:TonB-dependent receptor plug domain-containing protein [Rhodocyclaceae bacterium]